MDGLPGIPGNEGLRVTGVRQRFGAFFGSMKGEPVVNRLDAAGFGPLLDVIRLTSMDVGARGGYMSDLLPIARCVDMVGFEPDPDELRRLTAAPQDTPWASMTYLHYALGRSNSTQPLYVYSHSGNSSLYQADRDLVEAFGRGRNYELQQEVDVQVESLDVVVATEDVSPPDHLKVDVQGWELEILKGADTALDSVLAARLEVEFMPLYRDQPLFSDIDAVMQARGFALMGFPEIHAWRRTTRRKWPRRASGPYPYSRGQLAHGDALYLRWPDAMPENTVDDIEARIRLGLLACAYEYLDHAVATLTSPAVATYGREVYGIDFADSLSRLSKLLARTPAFIHRFRRH
jgi:FkbM family methyltransferase